jgi:hypothetical protein
MGSSNFVFYSNETAVDSTFFVNVTVTNVENMIGWAIGIIYESSIVNFTSAWRPSDHIFSEVKNKDWTIIAPAATLTAINGIHMRLMWSCTRIWGEGENGVFMEVAHSIRYNLGYSRKRIQ